MLGALFMTRFIMGGKEDFWFCREGEWFKHGNPLAEEPKFPCGPKSEQFSDLNDDRQEQVAGQPNESEGSSDNNLNKNADIIIVQPQKDELISGVLQVTGEAPGSWFFEGSFPVKIIDENDKEIIQGTASSYGEWMKDGPVPFHTEMNISKTSGSGWVVLQKDNPSGKAENNQEFRIPVRFGDAKKQMVKVFFGSNFQDPGHTECAKVYPVERVMEATETPVQKTLEELFKGTTELETKGEYFTGINPATTINSLAVSGGTAKIDFNDKLVENISSPCLITMIRSQITETLKQFPNVSKVVISINGKPQEDLQ